VIQDVEDPEARKRRGPNFLEDFLECLSPYREEIM